MTVASVPMMPTRPPRETPSAPRAPGSMTPRTGTFAALRIAGRAQADEVLQATTRSLIPRPARNFATSLEKRAIAPRDFQR